MLERPYCCLICPMKGFFFLCFFFPTYSIFLTCAPLHSFQLLPLLFPLLCAKREQAALSKQAEQAAQVRQWSREKEEKEKAAAEATRRAEGVEERANTLNEREMVWCMV